MSHSAWQSTKNKVHGVGTISVADTDSKKAVYEYEVGTHGGAHVTVTAFVCSDTGNMWVGPNQAFYIDASSGVVGGTLINGGLLLWCESMIKNNKSPHSKNELDKAIDRFEKQVDLGALVEAEIGPAGGGIMPLTDLREAFAPWFFVDAPESSTVGNVMIVSVEVDAVKACLEISNLDSGRAGKVWINIKSRKVTKATEGGKQTFPK
ncbi:MAG: hypothetical protein P1V20_08625 [Verrucomicrobiales bacterium]|nr:hypothetical protein [Verrucomicrobiales bacterium]